ncbi:MAG: S-layer homology domain-containing protein [Clostridia bacterium]|nr:S-layer homology domain-containing protein [Clostridia bacterium]
MKKWIISILFFALCTASCTSYAEALLDFSETSRTLRLSGSIQTDQIKGFVSFAVMPCETDAELKPTDGGTLGNVFYKTAETDADGNFNIEFSLPKGFEGGQYMVVYHSGDKAYINRFGIAADDFSEALSRINGAELAKELKAVLENLEGYRIGDCTMEKSGDRISSYLLSVKPDGGFTKDEFIKQYNIGEGIARFEADEISIGELLVEYSAYTDVDYSKTYAGMTELGRSETQKRMKNAAASVKGNFAEVFDTVYSVVEIVGVATPDELADTYIRSADKRGRNLDAYNKLSNYEKESVFLKMFTMVVNKNTLTEIDQLFDNLVSSKSSKDRDKTNGGGGGGSLANSGSSGMNGYIPPQGSVNGAADPNGDPAESGFSDVRGHWAESYISSLKAKGVINGFGDGTFRPDAAVTRAEFTKMVCTLFSISGGSCSFSDVKPTDWYYGAVCAAYGNGLIKGSGEGEFAPDEPITREDAAVIIQRHLKLSGTTELMFSDREQIADYSYEAVGALVSNGILKGYEDNTLNPRGIITRAEVSALITRAAQKFDTSEQGGETL